MVVLVFVAREQVRVSVRDGGDDDDDDGGGGGRGGIGAGGCDGGDGGGGGGGDGRQRENERPSGGKKTGRIETSGSERW